MSRSSPPTPDSTPDEAKAARQTALKLLTGRDHCSGALKAKLEKRGFASGLVDELVAALQREKLLDDSRYVENFVAYHADRGQGPVRIGSELRGLKLESGLIERALTEGQDWVARARVAREKKFCRAPPTDYTEKAKQARFLQYRGFTGGQIRGCLGIDIDIDSEP